MNEVIRVAFISRDVERISAIKRWVWKTNCSHKNKTISYILVPRDFRLTPHDIAEYASAINNLFPAECVTDYANNRFTTLKKSVLKQIMPNLDISADHYHMGKDDFGWHIISDQKKKRL